MEVSKTGRCNPKRLIKAWKVRDISFSKLVSNESMDKRPLPDRHGMEQD
jgi:hypothetical protein